MAHYHYQARERNGGSVGGAIEAADRQEALSLLTAQGLFPSRLEVASPHTQEPVEVAVPPPPQEGTAVTAVRAPPSVRRRGPRIRRRETTAFTREMATLLGAGIPIPAALEGLGEEEENAALKEVMGELLSMVRRGAALSGAMEHYPRIFPGFYTSTVAVGEESGALDRVFLDLAELMEREDETRGEVLSAVAYPCFVLSLGVVTTFILLAFVLPRLFSMLEGMADVLPLPTVILLRISDFFQEYWLWIGTGVIAGVALLRWSLRSPRGSYIWDSVKLRLPVLGTVFRLSAVGRFARMLGILLRSGVSLLPGLEIVRHTVGNQLVAARLVQVAEETRGGDSLASPLRRTGFFPATLVKMIAVGEETGRLDEMLLRVASIQDRLLRERSRTLVSLLGPALILVIGGLIGFIVIALLLPIFQMAQGIQ